MNERDSALLYSKLIERGTWRFNALGIWRFVPVRRCTRIQTTAFALLLQILELVFKHSHKQEFITLCSYLFGFKVTTMSSTLMYGYLFLFF